MARVRYLRLLLIMVLALCLPLRAGPDDLQVIVQPEVMIGRRIMILVDTSGSMGGLKIGKAIEAVNTISSQPTDEMELAVIAFNSGAVRWPGIPEEGLAPGWARLPSADAVSEIDAWLRAQGAHGNTVLTPALLLAMREPVRELSIVVVTDGRIQDEGQVVGILLGNNALREVAGLGRVVLCCYGVERDCEVLQSLGRTGGGGFYLDAVTKGKEPSPVVPNWR